jgi:uncharacterized protein (TIGR01370 family)
MKSGLILYVIIIVMVIFEWYSCSSNNTGPNPKHPQDTTKTQTTVDTAAYQKISPFGIDYSKINLKKTSGYKLIIAEPSVYNYDKAKVEALKANGATVLSYLSVGEVGTYRYYFDDMKKCGFLGENENFNSHFINLADSSCYNLFFTTIIPKIMKAGFDGLFLDTVDDVAPYTARNNLQPDMVRLIKQIQTNYPKAVIIQNDGLFLLDKTAKTVNAVLKEDIATLYNFDTKSYALRSKKSYKSDVQNINHLAQKYHIPFLLVDYAVSDSLRSLAEARLDTLAYPYFITDIGLDNLSNAVTGNNY